MPIRVQADVSSSAIGFFGGRPVELPVPARFELTDGHLFVSVCLVHQTSGWADLGPILHEAFGISGVAFPVRSSGMFVLQLRRPFPWRTELDSLLATLELPAPLARVPHFRPSTPGRKVVSWWTTVQLEDDPAHPLRPLSQLGVPSAEVLLYGALVPNEGHHVEVASVQTAELRARFAWLHRGGCPECPRDGAPAPVGPIAELPATGAPAGFAIRFQPPISGHAARVVRSTGGDPDRWSTV